MSTYPVPDTTVPGQEDSGDGQALAVTAVSFPDNVDLPKLGTPETSSNKVHFKRREALNGLAQ